MMLQGGQNVKKRMPEHDIGHGEDGVAGGPSTTTTGSKKKKNPSSSTTTTQASIV
jgi:hypothetical protein